MKNVDVLVIGAGAAGMAAALAAAEQGAKVLLVEREDRTGGILNQCIHNGFGLHYFKRELTGPEYAEIFREKLERSGIDTCVEKFVLEVDVKKREVIVVSKKGIEKIHPKSLILATGARERPFGSLLIPGDRPSGIYTAGVVQRLINIENRLPGKRALILGSGDIGLIMARRLTLEGMEVVGVVE
ncbi:MAG: pyridine nucleotide-disulfide oxidoreductase, partial [Thermotogae bacterium]